MPTPETFRPCAALNIRAGDAAKREPMMIFETVICPASADACPGIDACQYSENGRYLHERVYAGVGFTQIKN